MGLIIPHQKQVKNPILVKVKKGHHLRILVILQHPIVVIFSIHKLLVHHLPIRMCPITLRQVFLIVGQLLDRAQDLDFLVRDHFAACVDQDERDLALFLCLVAADDIRETVGIDVSCSEADGDCSDIRFEVIEIWKHVVKDRSMGLAGKAWKHIMCLFKNV